MEIILQHAKMKKKKYYLYDNFDKSLTKAFHELKGRYYKKENYWVFAVQNILPIEKNVTNVGKSNDIPPTTSIDDIPPTTSIDDIPPTTSAESTHVEHVLPPKYLYNPPTEMFHFVKPYTVIVVSSA